MYILEIQFNVKSSNPNHYFYIFKKKTAHDVFLNHAWKFETKFLLEFILRALNMKDKYTI